MKTVYVLFWCDAWLSKDSMRIASVSDDHNMVLDLALKLSEKSEEGKLSEEDKEQLLTMNQTQDRYENYIITSFALNKLITVNN
jgi:hypothetical protein